jgi:hypothetical protein
MVGPLRGGAVGPGASTINAKNTDAGPPKRLCQRSGSTTTQLRDVDGGPPAPPGVLNPVCCPSKYCDLHRQHK